MKYLGLFLLFALLGQSIASAQNAAPPLKLLISSTLASQPAIQKCGGAETIEPSAIQPLLSCLELNGAYATAIRVGHLAQQFFSGWSDYLADHPACCDVATMEKQSSLVENVSNAESSLYDQISRLESEEASNPQMPDYVTQHPGSCESRGIRKALGTGLSMTGTEVSLNNSLVTIDLAGSDDAQSTLADQALDLEASTVATCHFGSGEWQSALRYFQMMDNDQIAAYGPANYDWHMAIIADHMKDRHSAINYIRDAFQHAKGHSDSLARQIRYDYNRLGAAKIDARARLTAQRVADREAAAEAHQELAENHEYWDGISYDERRVIEHYGGTRDSNDDARPCSVSVDDSAYVGHMVIWYYDCITPGGIGRESWEFVNGNLMEHQTL